MPIAALIGTTVGYTDYYNSVFIEKDTGEARVVNVKIFEELYRRLDAFTAAFRSDCIEYVWNDPIAELFDHPEWYIQLVEDGIIRDDCGMDLFYPDDGTEIHMNPGSVILRNHEGNVRYMEYDDFVKYYDFPGSEFIDEK